MTQDQLHELRERAAKADEHWDRLLRTSADFDNFKKRAAREKQDAVKYANMPARWTILQRINVGLVAILGRLQAENNWRRIAEEMWPITNAAPATPLGKEEAIWWAQRQALRP